MIDIIKIMVIRIYSLHDPRRPKEVRYIGQTSQNLSERLSKHIIRAISNYRKKNSNHRCNWIGCLSKDGIKPAITLIEETDESNYIKREKFWIADYRSKGHNLVNSTEGGEGTLGYKFTEEGKKILRARKHRILTEEHKLKISNSMKGKNTWAKGKTSCRKGKTLSEQTKIKLSEAAYRRSYEKIIKLSPLPPAVLPQFELESSNPQMADNVAIPESIHPQS